MASKSTPINQLPNQGQQAQPSQNEQDNQLVNEILNEIETQNAPVENDNARESNNENTYQRQMDPGVNQQSFDQEMDQGGPSQEQIAQMQRQQMQQQMMEQQMMKESEMNAPAEKVSLQQQIVDQVKAPLLVALIVFALSFPFVNQLLAKVPKALSDTGQLTTIGFLSKSVFAGLLFYVVNKFVLE